MSDVTRVLYRPLQDSLRAAGFYLDRSGRRLLGLLMVADGIVVSLQPLDIRGADEAVLLTHDDLTDLFAQARGNRGAGEAVRHPDEIFPTGYEDFMRALGDAAARQGWTGLRLLRIGDEAILRVGPREARREIVLKTRDVEGILNHAFNRRGQGPLS